MRRIPFEELRNLVEAVLLKLGMEPERAGLSARLTAETDRDGVKTHGIARLPRFVQMVELGQIDVNARAERVAGFGALERWRGDAGPGIPGPGNLNAYSAMTRAMELAREHGIGAVALGRTSHWMRAGTYGWMATEAGFAAMCWSNTLPNLPPWGAKTPALGNNPLLIAVPHGEKPVVLDMAMSQFSYGTLSMYRARGQELPVVGGFDEHGELTRDAAAIEHTQRALPIGFWKGSGLAFVLDILGAMLAGGKATCDFEADALKEVGQSQVFLAIAPQAIATLEEMRDVVSRSIDFLHAAQPVEGGSPSRYPGEGVLRAREENLRLGVAVEDAAWDALMKLMESVAPRKGMTSVMP